MAYTPLSRNSKFCIDHEQFEASTRKKMNEEIPEIYPDLIETEIVEFVIPEMEKG